MNIDLMHSTRKQNYYIRELFFHAKEKKENEEKVWEATSPDVLWQIP